MASLVIVAIPEEDDYVHKISSEKIPHCTLLYLGDPTQNSNVSKMAEFLEHAASFSLERFWLEVDYRGKLGDQDADVLFFKKNRWNAKCIEDFRAALLKNDAIKAAYEGADQHEDWTPHLTLGYPQTPAKEDTRDYPGFYSVRFDKIALWYGDFEGPTFQLKEYEWDMDGGVAYGAEKVGDILEHHGVKGQKWGVRRQRGAAAVTVIQKKKKLKSTGGHGRKPSEDALKAKKIGQVKKKSGIHALTNEELQTYQKRLNLEQSVTSLERTRPGVNNWIKKTLKGAGNQQVGSAANQASTAAAKKAIEGAAKLATA